MTEEIDHTKRFIEMYQTFDAHDNFEYMISLSKALQIEHDWVIRLDAKLEWAQKIIKILEETILDMKAEMQRPKVDDENTRFHVRTEVE